MKILKIIPLVSLILFSGCGSGGGEVVSSVTSTFTKTISGKVVDGYIRDAKVCLDANNNRTCDLAETSTMSDENGEFTFVVTSQEGNFSFVAEGGIDTFTNEEFVGTFRKLQNITKDTSEDIIITPLTTLVYDVYEKEKISNNQFTYEEASDKLSTNFGLTKEQLLSDPTLDKAVFSKVQQIVHSSKILSKEIQKDESGTTKNKDLFHLIFKQIALSINDNNFTNEINTSIIISQLENETFDGNSISISNEVNNFLQNYIEQIDNKIINLTDLTKLSSLQDNLEDFVNIVKLKINDNNLSELDSVTAEINNTTSNQLINNQPVITGSPILQVNENTPYSFTPIIKDDDNDSLTLSIENRPSWALFNTSSGEISGTPSFSDAGIYSNIKISVTDSLKSVSLPVFNINVNNINRIPIFTSSPFINVNENQIQAITLNATDVDNDTITYSINSDLFNVNEISGIVTFKIAPDFETNTSYTFTATAKDGNTEVNQTVTINILDVADIKPTISTFTTSINENIPIDTNVGSIDVTSIGDSPITSYTLNDTTNFSIDSNGLIKSKTLFNFNTKSTYTLNAFATNSAGDSEVQTVTINISNVNENIPVFTSTSSASINENTIIAITLSATDSDNDTLTYSIEDGDSALFNIDENSGIVTFITAPDFEDRTSYSFTARVSDGENSVTKNVSLSILNVAEVIPNILGFTTSLDENVSIGTSVGVISIVEVGDTAITSFTLSDTTNFEISEIGAIKTKALLNFDTKSSHTLSIFATNGAGDSETKVVTINLNDINNSLPVPSICQNNNNKVLFSPESGNDNTQFNIYREGVTDELNKSFIKWNKIKDATNYRYDIEMLAAGSFTQSDVSTLNATELRFDYDGSLSGWNSSTDGKLVINTSNFFNLNDEVRVTVRAYNSSDTLISTSAPITITIGKEYIDKFVHPFWATVNNNSINLEWCALNNVSDFRVLYSNNNNDLNESLSTSTNTVSISPLTNNTEYFYKIAGNNSNGDGRFTNISSSTTSSNPTFNFSIDNVTFNQSVQIDLDNNINNTPLIANKPGVLRIFTNVVSPVNNQKVEIKITFLENGNEIKSILQEVITQDSSFNTADSTNKPIVIDINDTSLLSENVEFYVEIDPNNKIIETNENDNRYPLISNQGFNFEHVHKLRVNLIPIQTSNATAIVTNEYVQDLTKFLEAMYPTSKVEVTLDSTLNLSSRTPTDDSNVWSDILDDLIAYKTTHTNIDSSKEDIFYYGVIDKVGNDASGLSGLAFVNELSLFDNSNNEPDLIGVGRMDELSKLDFLNTTAHEIGHNHGSTHISSSTETNQQCGTITNPDTNYPYTTQGRIAKTGYNHYSHELQDKDIYHDIMGYCEVQWISDYTYNNFYTFQKKLDTHYNRTISSSSLAPKYSNKVLGQMVSGKMINDKFSISKIYEARKSKIISNSNTQYNATVKIEVEDDLQIPIHLKSLDHSEIKMFKFFIPSSNKIKSISINNQELEF